MLYRGKRRVGMLPGVTLFTPKVIKLDIQLPVTFPTPFDIGK